jgi:hypothetical protein
MSPIPTAYPAMTDAPKPEPELEQTTSFVNSKWMGGLLWFLAVLVMFSAYVYQKRTGPTYPLRGAIEVEGKSHSYRLVRSHETTADAPVVLPAIDGKISASLFYKRFKTDDAFREIKFTKKKEKGVETLVAPLPKQPAAGKLEYYVEVKRPHGKVRIPEESGGEDDNIIIRFKDPVPNAILFPHITMMFFSVLIGVRAGLAALVGANGMRLYSWIAFVGMTIGGMCLGPIVQKYAFGEYWTGFPWGGDLTDNKMLIMWIAWLLAVSTIGMKRRKLELPGRVVVVAATLVMMTVYLIPHSMRGSELDYSKLDQGVDPKEAIGTGD